MFVAATLPTCWYSSRTQDTNETNWMWVCPFVSGRVLSFFFFTGGHMFEIHPPPRFMLANIFLINRSKMRIALQVYSQRIILDLIFPNSRLQSVFKQTDKRAQFLGASVDTERRSALQAYVCMCTYVCVHVFVCFYVWICMVHDNRAASWSKPVRTTQPSWRHWRTWSTTTRFGLKIK